MAEYLKRSTGTRSRLLVATHSPALLDAPEAAVIHVERAGANPPDARGAGVRLSPLRSHDREAMHALGLTPSDMLRTIRAFVLVEGQHDREVLEAVIGEDLRRVGAQLIALRGATQLSAAQARFLFQYTDATLIPVLDNLDSDRVASGWEAVRAAYLTDGLDSARVALLRHFSTENFGKGTEVRVLVEFLSAALELDEWDRIVPFGLSQGDIIEYLPVRELVPGRKTWGELREAFAAESHLRGKRNFKAWLRTRGASVTDEQVVAAAKKVAGVPRDLVRLVKTIEANTRR